MCRGPPNWAAWACGRLRAFEALDALADAVRAEVDPFLRRQAAMRAIAGKAKLVMGGLFVFVGVAVLMKWHHMAEIWLLDRLPVWLVDLSVAL